MKILILDDCGVRHDLCDRLLGDEHDLTHTYTVEQAIARLDEREFDLAMLDHDLGGPHTGKVVARHIAKTGHPEFVLVHSWNPVGASDMCQILRPKVTVLRSPFGPQAIAVVRGLLS